MNETLMRDVSLGLDTGDTDDEWSRRHLLVTAGGLACAALVLPLGAGRLMVPAAASVPSVRSPGRGQLALTFDDGPHAIRTDEVLEILEDRGVPATFFVVGMKADQLPKVTRRIAGHGHRVQVHSWSHAWLTNKSTEAIKADLSRTARTVKRCTGTPPNAFRPPYGATSDRVRKAGAAVGLRQVMWNACPNNGVTSASVALEQILRYVRIARKNGQGATVLLHDGTGARATVVGLLPDLISELRQDGWQFVRYT